ncbi:MAG: sigma-70 family RNA polymerase sigma factor [Planctomycetota bacterium]|jgi:RNA polymerase sigma-70 factor (ECF subfamily)
MGERRPEPEPESLLEHRGFVRAVVRRLIPDDHQVDDIVQETYLAALRAPPRRAGALRAWLGRVGRNLALSALRGQGRRARRERTAARTERVPSAREAAEKLEHHRMVVDAVLALDEPLRSTILLRYYEDLPPRKIAAVQGVPVATVRSRLRRAVARMRFRFDEAHGGDRRAWCLALLPLLLDPGQVLAAATGAGGTTLLSVGGTAMKAKLTLAALVVCVLGTAFVVWRATAEDGERAPARSDATDRDAVVLRPPAVFRADEEETLREVHPDRGVPAEGEPSARAVATVRASAEKAAERDAARRPPPGPGLVTGTVRLADGRLPLRVKVTLRNRYGREERTFETGADGSFRFDGVAAGRYYVQASHPDFASRTRSAQVTESEGAGPLDIVLTSGGSVLVRAIGPGHGPVPDQVVRVRRDRSGSVGFSGRIVPQGPRTDAEGKILFEHLLPGRYEASRLIVDDEGKWNGDDTDDRLIRVQEGRTTEVVFDLSCGIAGTVLGVDGQPLAGALVRLVRAAAKEPYRNLQVTTEEDGSYAIPGCSPGEYLLSLQVFRPVPYSSSVDRVTLRPGVVLDRPIRVRPTEITGRITRADTGAPVRRNDVQISAYAVERRDGRLVNRGLEGAMAWADEQGRYAFTGLKPGLYKIWIFPWAKDLQEVSRIVDFSSGGTRVDLDFALETKILGTLRLRILAPDGSPATRPTFCRADEDDWVMDVRGKRVEKGVYEFPLHLGARTVLVYAKGYRQERVEVIIEKDQIVERTVTLREAEPEEEKEDE